MCSSEFKQQKETNPAEESLAAQKSDEVCAVLLTRKTPHQNRLRRVCSVFKLWRTQNADSDIIGWKGSDQPKSGQHGSILTESETETEDLIAFQVSMLPGAVGGRGDMVAALHKVSSKTKVCDLDRPQLS